MNTNSLKRFATTARNILLRGVRNRLQAVGFNEDGSVRETPEAVAGGTLFGGEVITDPHFAPRWEALRQRIQSHGVKEVVEEAAYTWFNRFMAIRILVRNGLAQAVLDYENPDVRLPRIVTDARAGKTPILSPEDRASLDRVIADGRLAFEQFAILIRAYCENNPILRSCFGGITDYTSLLLPADILAPDNFIDLLNDADSFISPEDYSKPELIGWLYQFYISEKKDEVFAKKGGYDSDEIPAATQIFTPNWIVKYMVENTLGRIYLDNNPDSGLAENWEYLVMPAEPTPADSILRYESLEQLTCADLSCGSGHILNEMFDLLMQLYEDDFYSPREAIEAIFTKNMVGLDLDIRARQLSQFALLLKACQRDSAFSDGHCLPRIYSFPDVAQLEWAKVHGDFVTAYSLVAPSQKVFDEIGEALNLMRDADSLGSIMKFDICSETSEFLKKAITSYDESPRTVVLLSKYPTNIKGVGPVIAYAIPDESKYAQYMATFAPIIDAFRVILALTDKYAAICMNPPYMSPNKTEVLYNYANDNYAISNADMATIFVEVMGERTKINGEFGFVIPPSWMFISAYSSFRKQILSKTINSLVQCASGIFGGDFGACSAIIHNCNSSSASKGTYFRLVDKTFQKIDVSHLRQIFENALRDKKFRFDFLGYSSSNPVVNSYPHGNRILYEGVLQSNFFELPSNVIAYWIGDNLKDAFSLRELSKICETRCGLATGRNDKFLRLWHEVDYSHIGFNLSRQEASQTEYKWFPYDKAGSERKWYGNQDYIVDWYKDGEELQTTMHPDGKRIWAHNFNLDKIFLPHIGWSDIVSTGNLSFRFYPKGFHFDGSANAAFCSEDWLNQILGYSNSKITNYIRPVLNPTIHFKPGNFSNLPFIANIDKNISDIVSDCVSISKEDWDAHETSWDFQTNPLLGVDEETYTENMENIKEMFENPTQENLWEAYGKYGEDCPPRIISIDPLE